MALRFRRSFKLAVTGTFLPIEPLSPVVVAGRAA